MAQPARKKSPRAPSFSLNEAIERVMPVYEKEHRHAAPTDVVAQDLGYKSANNGAALSAIASLRYYGLLEKAQEGKLAVSKDVESYRFAPNDEMKKELLIKWLKSPQIFAELLERYQDGLPSDATLRYDLIQRGFAPGPAESVLSLFRQSVEYAKYFEHKSGLSEPELVEDPSCEPSEAAQIEVQSQPVPAGADRIPVRLSGGRRAWLEIPFPFYSADKERLKAQIDFLLTEDDGDAEPTE